MITKFTDFTKSLNEGRGESIDTFNAIDILAMYSSEGENIADMDYTDINDLRKDCFTICTKEKTKRIY